MQVVGFRWRANDGWKPQLLLANAARLEQIELWSGQLDAVLDSRRCAGYWANGRYTPCPNSALLAPRCLACRLADDWACCASCKGSCVNPSKRSACAQERFIIYLATFGELLKVGISRASRWHERMIEQGADFGARLLEIVDGAAARLLEQRIAALLGCTDRVQGAEKARQLIASPNACALAIGKALTVLADAGFDIEPVIYDFRKYYKLGAVGYIPEFLSMQPGTQLTGQVIATKGNIIVLQTGQRLVALNAHELIGYELKHKN